MKLVITIIVTLTLFMTSAQNAESVVYELNTHQKIQSLRLSVLDSNEQEACSLSPIGSIDDSTVCLHLNPLSDYELLVNNTILIQIYSGDIQDSLMQGGEVSPISLVVARDWVISKE